MNNQNITGAETGRFNDLRERNVKLVYGLAYKLARNRDDAEDITSETFYRAYRSFEKYNGTDETFFAWLKPITMRLFLDLQRSRRRRIKEESLSTATNDGTGEADTYVDRRIFREPQDNKFNPEHILMSLGLSEKLIMALEKLSGDQRTVVILSDIMEKSHTEIAALMGKDNRAVTQLLSKAHKKLEALLNEEAANSVPNRRRHHKPQEVSKMTSGTVRAPRRGCEIIYVGPAIAA